MKAYKATYNGKNENFNLIYEVGKKYKLKTSGMGFHFCEYIEDLTNDCSNIEGLTFYDFVKDNKYNDEIVVFEIEVKAIFEHIKNKTFTDEFKIIRELSKEEILEGIKEKIKFDDEYNIIWRKYLNGNIVKYEYKNGNLTFSRDSFGNVREYIYKKRKDIILERDNLILERDNNGFLIQYGYDSTNNLIWKKIEAPSFEREFEYDLYGNVIWEKDVLGYIIESKYDQHHNCIRQEDNYGHVWEWHYTYNDKNNLIRKRNSDRNIEEWEYSDSKVIKKLNDKIVEEIEISN